MPSSTCATSWKTFTSNATKNHKLLKNIRTDPAKMALYGHPGFTEVSAKIEQDWRAFIAQAERVNQAKGYLKGRANLFALQLVDEYGPADLLRILITEFDVNTNLKDNKGTFMLETAVRRNVTENALVLVRGVGRNKFRSYELGYQMNLPCLAIRFKTTCVYDQISRTYTDSTADLVKAMLENGATVHTRTNLVDLPSVWCYAAQNGNSDTMRLLLAQAQKQNTAVDFNAQHREYVARYNRVVQVTPLAFVSNPGFLDDVDDVLAIKTHSNLCGCANCNMDMIITMIENGANPYMSMTDGIYRPGYDGDGYLDEVARNPIVGDLHLCRIGSAQLGMAMYERVFTSKKLVSYAMRGLPADAAALVCKFAGIGAKNVADTKTPWMPAMPIRTDDVNSMWFGSYDLIDERVTALKAARSTGATAPCGKKGVSECGNVFSF
jgi:hypothetical protein